MVYKIGICDDEQSTCAKIEKNIQEFFETRSESADIYSWNEGEGFCSDMVKGEKPDILFLDIELPGKNGVEVGQYIRKKLRDDAMHIIYVSSKTSYAMELFKNHPYDFLVKPVTKENVVKVLSELLVSDELDRRFYTYTSRKVLHKITVGNIAFLESRGRHIEIHLIDGRTEEFVGKLKAEMDKLPPQFVRISQSYIVNLKYVESCGYDHVIMMRGETLNITQPHRAEFKKSLREYNMGG